MNKVTLKINGMVCGMCDAHLNAPIRKTLPDAQKVRSSHQKGESEFLYDGDFDREMLIEKIKATGYECEDILVEKYQKKRLFGKWL